MSPDQWVTLVLQGGAAATLVIVGWLLITGRMRTGKGYDDMVRFFRERLADERANTDEWKALAKSIASSHERIASALEARNRRDEQSRRAADDR